MPKKIEVTRGAMQPGLPETEELRAFQNELLPVDTLAEPPKESPGRILLEHGIERDAGGP